MFRFAYADAPDELVDPSNEALSAFEGLEVATPIVGDGIVGRRVYFAAISSISEAPSYLSISLPKQLADGPTIARLLRETAERLPATLILIENGGAFSTVNALWDLIELTLHPRIKIAWDIDAGHAAGERAAVVVPTLNLRIGLVRSHAWNNESIAYAKRLAGIGFEAWWVCSPMAYEPIASRMTRGVETVAHLRNLLDPPKHAKKTASQTR